MQFIARPVIEGHSAFLTLDKACSGKAMAGLSFFGLRDKNMKKHQEEIVAALY